MSSASADEAVVTIWQAEHRSHPFCGAEVSFLAAAGTCLAAFLVAAMVLMSGFGLGTLLTPLFVVFYDIKIAVFPVVKEGCGRMRGRRGHRHDHHTDLIREMKRN